LAERSHRGKALRPLVLFGLLVVLAGTYGFVRQDWGGWTLLYAALAVVALDPGVGRYRGQRQLVLAAVLTRATAALYHVFVAPLPGMGYDVVSFHGSAMTRCVRGEPFSLAVGTEFYKDVLEALYIVTGPSPLAGQALSVLAGAASCLVFVRLLDTLEIGRGRLLLVALFGFLPSAVIFSSVTLRESFELLFFMLGVFLGVRGRLRDQRWLLLASAASFVLMGMFHQILLFFAPGAIAVVLLWPLSRKKSSRKQLAARAVLAGAGVALVVAVVVFIPARAGDDYIEMLDRGVLDALAKYRAAVESSEPRTSFGVDIDISSVPRMLASTGRVYFYYLFSPFPTRVENKEDAYAAAEAALRALLLFGAVFGAVRSRGLMRRLVLLLLAYYLSMSFVWTLGATNYGQAMRHHVLTNWLLFLAGGAGLFNMLGVGRRSVNQLAEHP
jgi:hypothetical protein